MPQQAEWFAPSNPEDLVVHSASRDNYLILWRNNTGRRNTGALVHFQNDGDTVALGQGQSLIVRLEFSLRNPVDNNNSFWIGLYNSRDFRMISDHFVTNIDNTRFISHPDFVNYSGYEASLNFAQPADPENIGSQLRRRPFDHNNERLLGFTGSVSIGARNQPGMMNLRLSNDVRYVMEFTIEHQFSRQVRSTLQILGGDLPETQIMTGTDPQAVETAFDTLIVWTDRHTSNTAFLDYFNIHEIIIERS